jgi:hypothetical protein
LTLKEAAVKMALSVEQLEMLGLLSNSALEDGIERRSCERQSWLLRCCAVDRAGVAVGDYYTAAAARRRGRFAVGSDVPAAEVRGPAMRETEETGRAGCRGIVRSTWQR